MRIGKAISKDENTSIFKTNFTYFLISLLNLIKFYKSRVTKTNEVLRTRPVKRLIKPKLNRLNFKVEKSTRNKKIQQAHSLIVETSECWA